MIKNVNDTKFNSKYKQILKIVGIIFCLYIIVSAYLYFCVWNQLVEVKVTDFSVTEIEMLSKELSIDFPKDVNISQGVYSNDEGLYLKVSGINDMCEFVNSFVRFDEFTLDKSKFEEILVFLRNSSSTDEVDEREEVKKLNVNDVYNSYEPSYDNLNYGRAVKLKDTINGRETELILYYNDYRLYADIHVASVKNENLRKIFKPLFAKRYE